MPPRQPLNDSGLPCTPPTVFAMVLILSCFWGREELIIIGSWPTVSLPLSGVDFGFPCGSSHRASPGEFTLSYQNVISLKILVSHHFLTEQIPNNDAQGCARFAS